MDCIIVAAPKDYSKLKYCLEHIEKNVFPKINKVYLLTPTKYDLKLTNLEVINLLETEVINYDKNRLKYRPNWQYAQFLKLFQDVSDGDEYLVIDSDHFLIKNINLYDEQKKPYFFLTKNQNAKQYFNFSKNVFLTDRVFNHSFISEIMIFNKNIIDNMLYSIGRDRKTIYEIFEKNINENSHISEYELYGNYVIKNHPNLYSIRKINQQRIAYRWHSYEEEEISNLLESFYKTKNQSVDSVRIDTYDL